MSKYKINISFEVFTFRRSGMISVIKKCIETTLDKEGVNVPCEINVLITNDKGIHAINKANRDIDAPTDVLSFPMFQFVPKQLPEIWEEYLDPETGRCPLGDMAISLERAISQAKEFGHSIKREVGYLTIHSMLHLLGYDHLDEGEDKALMRSVEESIASQIHGLKRN